MPEKQRGEVDFTFRKGCFRDYSSAEPLQLYHFFEREGHAGQMTEKPVLTTSSMLLFCVSGSAKAIIDGQAQPFESGNVIVYKTDSECVIDMSQTEAPLHYFGVEYAVFERISPLAASGDMCRWWLDVQLPIRLERLDDLYVVFSTIIDEFSLSPRHGTMVARGSFYQMLVMLYRRFHESTLADDNDVHSIQNVGHTVYAIIRYIDEHLYSMDHLTGMAQELGYSYNYLSHLFRKKTGMTIQAYVSRKKIEKSTELLTQQQLSITEVAALLNYDCIQSFSKAFKRAMNMSPTEYRALYGLTE